MDNGAEPLQVGAFVTRFEKFAGIVDRQGFIWARLRTRARGAYTASGCIKEVTERGGGRL